VPNPSHAPISDSMQMYLVTIARLREHQDPVPLSKLAEALSVSPVSVNEMCRKLQEQGLLVYQPYKGVARWGTSRPLHPTTAPSVGGFPRWEAGYEPC
jgi:MarR-like DNA-binding transcriptional regulator SgrR of sgrS sRNA